MFPKLMHFTKAKGKFAPGEILKKVRPEPSTGYILNPHKGMATFQAFNGDPLFPGYTWREEGPTKFNFKQKAPRWSLHYLPTTVSYCRWFWVNFESEEGKFDFSMVENALKMCKLRGQTLQVRLMAYGMRDVFNESQPQLPEWFRKIAPVTCDKKDSDGNPYFEPDYKDPLYMKYWSRVIREFGKRYGKHPDIDTVDVALLGPWGEGAGNISRPKLRSLVDDYFDYFEPNKIVANGGGYSCEYTIKNGGGWRVDGLGALENWGHGVVPDGLGWNHHFDAYPEAYFGLKHLESWKHAPSLMEVGKVFQWDYDYGMTEEMLDFALQQGLKYHLTAFSAKQSRIPERWKDKILDFCDKIGYKFIFRQLKYTRKLAGVQKNTFEFDAWIENTGVAPIYRNLYELAFRLTQGKKSVIIRSKQDITSWLPGDVWIKEKIKVPAGFSEGEIMIEAGIVRKGTDIAAVKFSNKNVDAEGWLEMDTVELR